jgi:acetylornithine/N-succinyldiaminopimelate aminotransferase
MSHDPSATTELIARAERAFLPNYKPAPMVLDHGKGAWLFDKEGKDYVDLVGGIAVSSLGHGHPGLVAAIHEQAGKLIHASNLYWSEPSIRLAERLVAASFADRVFFSNSGAEANEAAIKLARRHAWLRGEKDRVEIVSFHNSFHGRTLGALAATAQPKYHEGFAPMPPGFVYLPMGDVAALDAAVGPRTAAILIEPIQGEGGVRPAPPGFLTAVRQAADRVGALVVFDEIQCGFGRTGKMWAYEHEGVTPDVMSVAKGIAGGLPLGAILCTSQAGAALTYGSHGTTFGGNPVATAAGLVVMDTLESPGFLAQVAGVGERLRAGLQALGQRHGLFSEVRGRGLILGAELAPGPIEAKHIVDAARDHGVLVHVAGPKVLRLVPPLVLTARDVDAALERLERAVVGLGK